MENYPENYLVEVGYGYERNNEYMFSRNNYLPYGAINNFIKARNSYSSFCTTFRYNTKDIDNSLMYGDMYFDFDDINDFETVRKDAITVVYMIEVIFQIKKDWLRIYFSGNKGVHIIVPAIVLGVEPHSKLNHIYKYIANMAKGLSPNKTVDTQIYDNKRLFRIPNTIHEKSKLYKIPITIDELENLSSRELKDLAKQPRELPVTSIALVPNANKAFKKIIAEYELADKQSKKDSGKRYKKSFDFIPPCIQNILDNGAQEGVRNITIACLAGFYRNFGKTLDETIEIITDWNDNNLHPTGTGEMTKTIKSIFNSDKQYGCTTLAGLSVCSETCKIQIKKEEKKQGDKEKEERQKILKQLM